jgi:hypothetical protein
MLPKIGQPIADIPPATTHINRDIVLGGTGGDLLCAWDGCGIGFDDTLHFNRHVEETHIGKLQNVYVCRWNDCPRFGTPIHKRNKMQAHMRMHTDHRPFHCLVGECDARFRRPENLHKHWKSKHDKEDRSKTLDELKKLGYI